MLTIGPFSHSSQVVVAPMAGVTDRPFRDLCRSFGTYWAVSEMVTSDMSLWHTMKSSKRLAFVGETGPRWVQLAGSEPQQLAQAAIKNVELGAQIIDINMGCPAKKVCKKAAGSALLRDEKLVEQILAAVVSAVTVPVTLKIRLGWSTSEKNVVTIAKIAQEQGVELLTIHGRTRECRFVGQVDYDAIGEAKAAVTIPVIANGDIRNGVEAKNVLAVTHADAVMVGRAVQGRPWLPGFIDHFLQYGITPAEPELVEIKNYLLDHHAKLLSFYGEYQGLRIARKHIGWTLDQVTGAQDLKQDFNRSETSILQRVVLTRLVESRRAA